MRGGKKLDRILCGAKTRQGRPCMRRSIPGKARCRNHGGLSCGPTSPEGRARALANLKQYRRLPADD